MPESIMLIVDDTNLRQSIALILKHAGYYVNANDSVDVAMDLVRSRNYHLILADLNLPELKAILLPKAPDIFLHIPILLLADQSFSADMEEKLFRIHYLVKPIAPEQLLESVEAILTKKNNPTHFSQELHRGSNQTVHKI